MAAVKELSGNAVWSALNLVVSLFLWSALNSPLKEFPGPLLAGITNFWRLWDVYRGHNGETHLKLHRKHGSVVRLGPNVLSLSDPSLINRVYTTKSAWNKVSENLNPSLISEQIAKGNTNMTRVISTASMMQRWLELESQLFSRREMRDGTRWHCAPSAPYIQ